MEIVWPVSSGADGTVAAIAPAGMLFAAQPPCSISRSAVSDAAMVRRRPGSGSNIRSKISAKGPACLGGGSGCWVMAANIASGLDWRP